MLVIAAGFLYEELSLLIFLSFLRTLEGTRHTKPQVAFFSVLKNDTTPELKNPCGSTTSPLASQM
ncbi:hypothetical protein VH15_07670 [Corynebacterium ulcerans]|nr:hypothetical protein VH15_07670 [Corynebacterium ulcerans]